MKKRWFVGLLAAALALWLAASPADAHTYVERNIGYNTNYNSTTSNGCNNDLQHGNYGGAYINGKMNNNATCIYLYIEAWGCQGWNCPSMGGAATYDSYTWITSGASGWSFVYSHSEITDWGPSQLNRHNTY